jgi:C_GCAxxG_C_C family probable redox protein
LKLSDLAIIIGCKRFLFFNYLFKNIVNKSEKAVSYFKTLNCNQAVFAAFGPDYGVSEELCIKLGLSYGGGMGRQGKTCGAVTGAYNVIGLWAAGRAEDLPGKKKLATQKVLEFNHLFTKFCGNLECKDLLGYNLSIPEEEAQIKEQNLFDTICPNLVGKAAEILEEILK